MKYKNLVEYFADGSETKNLSLKYPVRFHMLSAEECGTVLRKGQDHVVIGDFTLWSLFNKTEQTTTEGEKL